MNHATTNKCKFTPEQWIEMERLCKESGLGPTAWCRENNVNLKQYYYHRSNRLDPVDKQIPVEVGTLSAEEKIDPSITIQMPYGIIIKIPDSISVASIEAVIRALKC